LEDIYKRNGEYWKNHFNTIGLNGMNEALINLMGENITEEGAKEFALEVMDYMREKLLIYQKETGEMFNLEATPAEGTAYRFARLDKALYPKIVCANDKESGKEQLLFIPIRLNCRWSIRVICLMLLIIRMICSVSTLEERCCMHFWEKVCQVLRV